MNVKLRFHLFYLSHSTIFPWRNFVNSSAVPQPRKPMRPHRHQYVEKNASMQQNKDSKSYIKKRKCFRFVPKIKFQLSRRLKCQVLVILPLLEYSKNRLSFRLCNKMEYSLYNPKKNLFIWSKCEHGALYLIKLSNKTGYLTKNA